MADNYINSNNDMNKTKHVLNKTIRGKNNEEFKDELNYFQYMQDLLIIVILTLVFLLVSRRFDLMEIVSEFVSKHETWEVDEILATMLFATICFAAFAVRRAGDFRRYQKALIEVNEGLLMAMAEIKKLKGILPICASCKKIRDDKGYWQQVEMYIKSHSDADFSHSICPECAKKLYPDIKLDDSDK